jgi:hypothetical protein
MRSFVMVTGAMQIAVEPLVDAVVGDVERRELHFGRGGELAALHDLGERIVREGGAREAEESARGRERGQSALKRVPPREGDLIELRHCRAPIANGFECAAFAANSNVPIPAPIGQGGNPFFKRKRQC